MNDYKNRVSRSLTDLQKSLDEACKQGLPDEPIPVERNSDTNVYKNDLLYNSTSRNLQNLLSRSGYDLNEEFVNFAPPTKSDFLNYARKSPQENNSALVKPRDAYLLTLRNIVSNKPPISKKSQSYEALPRNVSTLKKLEDYKTSEQKIEKLRLEIMELTQYMNQERQESLKKKEEKERDEESAMEIVKELQRRLETARERESALISQAEDMLNTVDQAKQERSQALLESKQLDEELSKMRTRFDGTVKQYEEKLQNNEIEIMKKNQERIRQVCLDLDEAKTQCAEYEDLIRKLKEQLTASEGVRGQLEAALDSARNERDRIHSESETRVARIASQCQDAERMAARSTELARRDVDAAQHQVGLLQEEVSRLQTRLSNTEHRLESVLEENLSIVRESDAFYVEAGKKEQQFSEKLKEIQEQYEKELTKMKKRLDETEKYSVGWSHRHVTTVEEADRVMQQQLNLINRLKQELTNTILVQQRDARINADEIDELRWRTEKAEAEVDNLRSDRQFLQESLDDMNGNMESMRTRLKEAESKLSKQDSEIIELMESRNGYMRQVEQLNAAYQKLQSNIYPPVLSSSTAS